MQTQYNKIHYSRNEYRELYLQSPDWRAKSSKILFERPICQICDKNPSVEVHHLSYDRLEHEDLNKDLAAVCRECHSRIHQHAELTAIHNLDYLKRIFFKSQRKVALRAGTIGRILDCHDPNKIRAVAAVLNVDFDDIKKSEGMLIHYFDLMKIFRIIQRERPWTRPRKGQSEAALIRKLVGLKSRLHCSMRLAQRKKLLLNIRETEKQLTDI